jgi:hypothetical protein
VVTWATATAASSRLHVTREIDRTRCFVRPFIVPSILRLLLAAQRS